MGGNLPKPYIFLESCCCAHWHERLIVVTVNGFLRGPNSEDLPLLCLAFGDPWGITPKMWDGKLWLTAELRFTPIGCCAATSVNRQKEKENQNITVNLIPTHTMYGRNKNTQKQKLHLVHQLPLWLAGNNWQNQRQKSKIKTIREIKNENTNNARRKTIKEPQKTTHEFK